MRISRAYSFYPLVVTQTLSLIGSRMTAIGGGIYLFKSTNSTSSLLLMVLFFELPGMLWSSLAGVWVDRWGRRKVILFADLGQAIGTLVIASWSRARRLESLLPDNQPFDTVYQGESPVQTQPTSRLSTSGPE